MVEARGVPCLMSLQEPFYELLCLIRGSRQVCRDSFLECMAVVRRLTVGVAGSEWSSVCWRDSRVLPGNHTK